MKRGKKGQVTLFIILGVLVLGLVGLFFFLRSSIVEERVQEARPVAEDVPTEFNPLKVFTEDCLKLTVEEGMIRLGQQGGYIRPREWQRLRFDAIQPTDSDGVAFAEDVNIPYWYYNNGPNNELTVSLAKRVPTVEDMEDELERWVEEELAACLNGYDVFLREFAIEEGDTTATVNILPGIVHVAVEHPLTIQWRDSKTELHNFYVESKSDIVRLHQVASEIVNLEQEYSYLEGNTLSLISLFSDVDDGKLMPMTAATFNLASTEIWSKNSLKEQVKALLMYYTPMLRVLGARNFYGYRYPSSEPYVDVKQRIYNDMILQLDGDTAGIEVRFNYLDFWEPYFDMNCEGDVCMAQSTVTPLTFPALGYFGMQRYKGVYDISYPVLVSLRTPPTESDEGYIFNFALEANIRNNRAAFDGVLPAPLSTFKSGLLCEQNQKSSGDITISVHDALSGEGLPRAAVSYVLGDESCSIGLTDEGGVVVERFPSAVGGVAHALLADHIGSARPLDPQSGKEESVDIELWPYKLIELEVQKKRFVKCGAGCVIDGVGTIGAPEGAAGPEGWSLLDVPMPLRDTEQAVVSFERMSEFDDPVSFSARVTGEETVPIRLPAGNYRVTISLILDEEVVIPSDEICEDASTGINPFDEDEECFTIPEVKMQPFPNGGLQWNEEVLLEIEPNDYYSADKLTLYALSSGIAETPIGVRTIKDLSLMGGVVDYSADYKDNLQPTYG